MGGDESDRTGDALAALLASGLSASTPDFERPPFSYSDEEVYRKCVSPSDALARFPYDKPTALIQLGREIAADRVQAIAHEVHWGDGQEGGREAFMLVPIWAWPGDFVPESDFWRTGYMERYFPVTGYLRTDRWIKLFDIRFWPDGLPGGADRPTAATSTPSPPPPEASGNKSRGGRPAGKHGEPIARITMRVLSLSPEELAGYTAASLAQDLIAEFKRLNLAPPSLDNAERDAAGILRAVRN